MKTTDIAEWLASFSVKQYKYSKNQKQVLFGEMMKSAYKVEMKQTLVGTWLVTLWEITDRGKAQVRSATCPEEGQAERMKELWEEQFVNKKEEE